MSDKTIDELLAQASATRQTMATTSSEARSDVLERFADNLAASRETVLQANAQDCEQASAAGLSKALCDRLDLAGSRFDSMIESVLAVAALPDPIHAVYDEQTTDAGIRVAKVRVPIGLICFIYESRPSVTADGAALCLKSGNAVILRGGSEALRSNLAIAAAAHAALQDAKLPEAAVTMMPTSDRGKISQILDDDRLDLVIPRGGAKMVEHVRAISKAPVLSHLEGNCHLYIDKDVDADKAIAVVVNAKVSRPGTCNALESLLVHSEVAADILPRLAGELHKDNVELVGCERTAALLDDGCKLATASDWDEEYLDLKMSIRVVDSLGEAIEWINTHGSAHTDGILTSAAEAASVFKLNVDSSSVMVNASTRFADGFMYGLGAETGISTGRLHVRGPVGLEGLTTMKWVVHGDYTVR